MSDKKPLVSIIIPVLNGEKFIREAITSSLEQTYPNLEIIVIDDGSTDDTFLILRDYEADNKIKLLFHDGHRNLGVSRSRKLGIDKAEGKFIALLDADDVYVPTKISTQVDILSQYSSVVLCHTNVDFIGQTEDFPRDQDYFRLSDKTYEYSYPAQDFFLQRQPICNSTTIVRTDVLRKLPFSSPQLFQYEDWLMCILAGYKGRFLYLPDKLTKYRCHSDASTFKVRLNPLRGLYSKIELLFCLSSRITDSDAKALVETEVKSCLENLYNVYSDGIEGFKESDDSREEPNDLLDRLPVSREEYELLRSRKRCAQLECRLKAIETSKIWKLRKFSAPFRRFLDRMFHRN